MSKKDKKQGTKMSNDIKNLLEDYFKSKNYIKENYDMKEVRDKIEKYYEESKININDFEVLLRIKELNEREDLIKFTIGFITFSLSIILPFFVPIIIGSLANILFKLSLPEDVKELLIVFTFILLFKNIETLSNFVMRIKNNDHYIVYSQIKKIELEIIRKEFEHLSI